jgi:hypothetical protein
MHIYGKGKRQAGNEGSFGWGESGEGRIRAGAYFLRGYSGIEVGTGAQIVTGAEMVTGAEIVTGADKYLNRPDLAAFSLH